MNDTSTRKPGILEVMKSSRFLALVLPATTESMFDDEPANVGAELAIKVDRLVQAAQIARHRLGLSNSPGDQSAGFDLEEALDPFQGNQP